MEETNASGGDFKNQDNIVEVLERKTTLASFQIAIDDCRLAVDVWTTEISGLIDLYKFENEVASKMFDQMAFWNISGQLCPTNQGHNTSWV